MAIKGVNAITLPVYSEVVKQVPEIVKKAMEEGVIPSGISILEIEGYDTPFTQDQVTKLKSGKYWLKVLSSGIIHQTMYAESFGQYIIWTIDDISEGNYLLIEYINLDDISEGNTINDIGWFNIKLTGGTKLYRHEIVDSLGGEEPEVDIVIISKEGSLATNLDNIYGLFSSPNTVSAKTVLTASGMAEFITYATLDSSDNMVLHSQTASFTIRANKTYYDTVTPL